MRMNQEDEHRKRTVTAYDVVNTYPFERLTDIFFATAKSDLQSGLRA